MSLTKVFKRLKSELTFLANGGVVYARSIGVKVGKNCRIYTNRFGKEPYLIEIGDNVTITSNVVLLTHDGSTWLFRDDKGRRYTYRRVKIGSNVFIGVNSIIMPGVEIENDVIIGAGSIVTKSIPKGSIVAGNPAKIIGNYYDYKKIVLEEHISDANFIKNFDRKQNILEFVKKSTFKPMLVPPTK